MGWLPHALDLQGGEGAIGREDGKISVDYDGRLESGFCKLDLILGFSMFVRFNWATQHVSSPAVSWLLFDRRVERRMVRMVGRRVKDKVVAIPR